jgi:hypothetical protein
MTRIIAALVISTAALTLSAPATGAHEPGTLAFVSLRDGKRRSTPSSRTART